ncbi:hypothetical protein AB0J94_20565 [Micromonospora noduli]|uniref:Uncharacterized protein n=1 Tax=Micromonospora noduli TaxID=709876 RepID=A0A328N4R3_9ACTN|nr:hypothetical protein [Micromonospora noduli]RAN96648.1 hypothetical protein LAH08_05391 [Micromonospora noduli]RAO16612.1 hypothetical protein GUI43_01508 [Micromonospora noduli]RAO25680.1 hypothetical protein ONO86_06420 [Micromonospora noduli]RAO31726.1 hypothetical protein ONO23_03486 [Micromonospora noduli]
MPKVVTGAHFVAHHNSMIGEAGALILSYRATDGSSAPAPPRSRLLLALLTVRGV